MQDGMKGSDTDHKHVVACGTDFFVGRGVPYHEDPNASGLLLKSRMLLKSHSRPGSHALLLGRACHEFTIIFDP